MNAEKVWPIIDIFLSNLIILMIVIIQGKIDIFLSNLILLTIVLI